ncbi:hypothetical protein SERLADRAFT_443885 [Serpula lacrymans var. lacrymans S7.9]|uniref:Uncharacterized protein n=1 Tax=Serpula lacrymans var. lacrymans (strain S7.9) TaxID=578457 RepID=F8PDV0_SERL9|nr:uncharacterized protein SERLADRAFT_443885 [Serpula lacrymans var. lacrymans S7.9]EGO18547.1 hypothetical protein SERLADRAFT_443885 [Serpula lacrymans var. lacrymans S7.9]
MDSDPDSNRAPDFSICNHTQTPAQDNLQMISNPAIKAYYDQLDRDNHSSLQSQPPANPLPSSPDIINFDWGLLDNPSHVVLDLPPEQEAVASIALAALDHFNALLDSSNKDLEWSDAPSNDDLPEVTSTMVLKQPVMDANVLVLQTIQQPHGGGSLGKTRL